MIFFKLRKLQVHIISLGDDLTCPAVKMAMLRSLCPKKARLLVGKLFSCSALPVARSKIQYLTQLPVFRTAWTPERQKNNFPKKSTSNKNWYKTTYYVNTLSHIDKDPPLESTFTARISAFSGMHSFLGVRWKQSGTLGVPPVLTTCSNTLKETKSTKNNVMRNTLSWWTHHLYFPNAEIKTNNNRIIHVCTCSSSILRSRQSCSSDDGSESAGAAVLWVLILLDVPGNFTATYAPSTLST